MYGKIYQSTGIKGKYHSIKMHAKLSSETKDKNVYLSLHLHHKFQCASREGSGETVWMCILVRYFLACISDKYRNVMN